MTGIKDSSVLHLRTVVTGMHLSPEFGLTYRTIEQDGFVIDDRVEMLLSSDTPAGVAKAIGLGAIGFGDCFARMQPDMVMMLGDRFELLAAAQAALVARIPVAHISGGDTTEGAIDEAIRHSITKMSHLHFVTNTDALRRVRQLGEDPRHVHLTGNPGLDLLAGFEPLPRKEVEKRLGMELRPRNLLITFHPVTLDRNPSEAPFQQLLDALSPLDDVGLIFTMPNADTFGRALIGMIDCFVAGRSNAVAHTSLGQDLYFSALHHVDAVVGNSSSGLLEAPSFKTPTVNIGDRQKGRLKATSVIDCPAERKAIAEAIDRAFDLDCGDVSNPYGDETAAAKIVAVLENTDNPADLVKKRFFDQDARS